MTTKISKKIVSYSVSQDETAEQEQAQEKKLKP